MSGFTLKVIACISMLIDHITYCVIANGTTAYIVGRAIGRLAFPIYAFLIVEGLFHTHNVKKYMLRLGIFALISEIPFDLAFNDFPAESMWSMQNVFFTLLLGLIGITAIRWLWEQYIQRPFIYNTMGVFIIIAVCLAAELISCDYSSIGVLLILIFYFFRGKKMIMSIAMLVWIGTAFYVGLDELTAILALIPIFLYNGKRLPGWLENNPTQTPERSEIGHSGQAAVQMSEAGASGGRSLRLQKLIQYAFYAYYPAHLLILGLIEYIK